MVFTLDRATQITMAIRIRTKHNLPGNVAKVKLKQSTTKHTMSCQNHEYENVGRVRKADHVSHAHVSLGPGR